MSDDKKEKPLTKEAFALRQKNHVFMTSKEAEEWNNKQVKNPVKAGNWALVQAREERLRALAAGWKRLAKKQHRRLGQIIPTYRELADDLRAAKNQLTQNTTQAITDRRKMARLEESMVKARRWPFSRG